MKTQLLFGILLFCLFNLASLELSAQNSPHNAESAANPTPAPESSNPVSAERALNEMKFIAEQIESSPIGSLPVHHNGRLKPLDTLARESLLFITGSYSKFSLSPLQMYLALIRYENSGAIELVEIRDVDARVELGFLKGKRFYSLNDLRSSRLADLGAPLVNKQQQNKKSLTPRDKAILEVYSQAGLLNEILSGQQLTIAADYSFLRDKSTEAGQSPHSTSSVTQNIQSALQEYFQSLNGDLLLQREKAQNLIRIIRGQEAPELFQHYLDKMDIEILFNRLKIFLLSAIASILVGIIFLIPKFQGKISTRLAWGLYAIPLGLLVLGIGIRIYITQFAPVTNMYTTMLWVALGVMFFSGLLFGLYRNHKIPAMTLIASGFLLMLTHQIPLILSPDLDPIVAVLRNNFWLSTHVTTITISYAAYTIAMIFGNVLLIRLWIYKDNEAFIKEYSHYAYRMIQLGCFLLTVGIILGGIWADYSWGRFWGWDPKETWALIADLGFLAILHGRYIGWITPFSLLAWSPAAYLLVIMAWYGVNFVLAAGLHSYGFSSGGAAAMAIFVAVQLVLLGFGFIKIKAHLKSQIKT